MKKDKEAVARKILDIRKEACEGFQKEKIEREELPAFELPEMPENLIPPKEALEGTDPSLAQGNSIPESYFKSPSIHLPDWSRIWNEDLTFRITSHRPGIGKAIVFFKKILRKLFRPPLNDLWDRQRIYNLVLISHLGSLNRAYSHFDEYFKKKVIPDILNRMDGIFSILDRRIDSLEDALNRTGLEINRRDAAVRERLDSLVEEAARAGSLEAPKVRETVEKALDELDYLRYENIHRGSQDEIRSAQSVYVTYFAGSERVLDIGCGRGEFLELCRGQKIPAYGIDRSREMIRVCKEKGLEAIEGDALAHLLALPPSTLGGIFSAQVIEHMDACAIEHLTRVCHEKMKKGSSILLETQNPLSLVVGASEFYKDPSHVKPIHPEAIRFMLEKAGFREVDIRFASPFPEEQNLRPLEIPYDIPEATRMVLEAVNARIERLNKLLYGYRDFFAVAKK